MNRVLCRNIGRFHSTCIVANNVTTRKTHEVLNVSHPLVNYNVFKSDPALIRAIKHFGNGVLDGQEIRSEGLLTQYGAKCGSEDMIETATLAERNRPVLKQFDNFGHRVDIAEFHPSYHKLMTEGKSIGVGSYGYNYELTKPDAHVTRSALLYMANQVDPGVCCPLVMNNAAIPVLRRVTGCEVLVEKLCKQGYDGRNVPMEEKECITAGMSMTEKQGGSDVRSNTTTAVPADESMQGEGKTYYLTGHKWFTSAPMCDVFLTLAKTPGSEAPSCFLVPRWIPPEGGKIGGSSNSLNSMDKHNRSTTNGGHRNEGFKVMRLKEKLADRSNASSEVEYDNAWAMMIGQEGQGVKCIIEMVQSTRLDCALGSAGMGRKALSEALYYTSNRSAFGAKLSEQPLMMNLLADLCVEAEANTLMAMKMAHLYSHEKILDSAFKTVLEDENLTAEQAGDLFRIGVAVSKYYITKRLPNFVYECMECHGGNGFVEEMPMARMYRHAPLNSIWEGSGNVIALDVLRAAKHIPLFMDEVRHCSGIDPKVDIYIHQLENYISDTLGIDASAQRCTTPHAKKIRVTMSPEVQRQARYLVDQMAIALQASLMLRYGCPHAASLYIASRVNIGNMGIVGSTDGYSRNGINGGLNYGAVPFPEGVIRHVISDNMPVFD